MKKISVYSSLALLVMMTITVSGCEAVAGIFKAGVWVGILIVVVIIIVLIRLFAGGKK
jgi:hypothetical protein